MSSVIGQNISKWFILIVTLLLGVALVVSSWAYLSLERQAILGLALLAVAFVVSLFPRYPKRRFGRILLIIICLFLSARYWMFRTTVTLTYAGFLDFTFATILYIAETYGIVAYLLSMFVSIWPIERRSIPLPDEVSKLPLVDVYIPTYNEPIDVVRLTAIAASQLDYPQDKLNLYILDDGGTKEKISDPNPTRAKDAAQRSQAIRAMAQELGFTYVTRKNNTNAKAGNLNHALMAFHPVTDTTAFDGVSYYTRATKKRGGDLILVLDCDHAPAKDFLQRTVGFFIEDPKLFLVQTPHYFINPDPVEKNLRIFRKTPAENEMFYGAIHLGLDFWNASFFCGSAAILRRKPLVEAGGIAGRTITEDAETALELHAKGFNSLYLNKPLIVGLTPETFEDFIVQRSRWAQGMAQIFILKNPLFKKGLSMAQRICYFNSCFFWFFGIARVVFFLSPLLLLFFGLRIYNASLAQVLAYAAPHLLAAYLLSNYMFGRFRHPFISELYETVQSIYLLPAVLSVIFKPKTPTFKVTPKTVSLQEDFLSHLATPFYIMLSLCISGYFFGIYQWYKIPQIGESIAICLFWNTFNIIILLCCLGVVWERRQIRAMPRYPTEETATLENPATGERYKVTIVDLSVSGIGIEITEENSHLATGTEYIMQALDSFGNQYSLPVHIASRRKKGNKTILGCTFNTNGQDLNKIVSFVYGDSQRWNLSGQLPNHEPVSILSGLLYILKLGVVGFFINTKGVSKLLFQKSKKLFMAHSQRI